MPVQVECQDVSVAVEGAVLLPATSFVLASPGLVALTGVNGAGKTTLLKTLAGRILPTEGECLINRQKPHEFDPAFRAAVASLVDTPPMARDMMVAEQLALVEASWGGSRAKAFQKAEDTLERLTIPELGERFPYELSSGQLQLFALGLTLSRPFELLLLDEPERHLDGDRVQALLSILETRASEGALVVTATHRPEIVERTSDRVPLG